MLCDSLFKKNVNSFMIFTFYMINAHPNLLFLQALIPLS